VPPLGNGKTHTAMQCAPLQVVPAAYFFLILGSGLDATHRLGGWLSPVRITKEASHVSAKARKLAGASRDL
jgi:hypothetical protein